MPPGRKPKQQVEADPDALKKLDKYRVNWGLAMTELIRIRPRDKGFATSPVIPFTLRPAQEKAFRDIQLQRSFNILKSLKRNYKDSWENILCSILGESQLPPTAWRTCLLILAKRPEWVLHELHTTGYRSVTDSPVLVIIVKARQLGFSTLIQVLLFLYALFNPRSKVLVVSSDDKSVEHVLGMTATLVDEWPQDMLAIKPELVGESRDRLELFNKSQYESRSSDGKRIHGSTPDANHFTEYAHYKNEDKVAAAMVAIPSHGWIFIESTSAGPAGDYYEKAKAAISVERLIRDYDERKSRPERQYIKVFCSWLEDPLYTTEVFQWETEEGGDFHVSKLDDYELSLLAKFPPGRLDEDGHPAPVADIGRLKWRREKITNDCQKGKDRNGRNLTPEQYFKQEFPADENEAFQEASGAVFPMETVLRAETEAIKEAKRPYFFRIRDEKTEPQLVLSADMANLIVYTLPKEGRQYAIGADIGKGRGKDNTVFTGVDRLDGTVAEEVFHFSSNHFTEVQTAHICAMLGRWFNDAFIVPEVTGAGQAFVDRLCQEIQYTNVYIDQARAKLGGTSKGHAFGYDTNSSQKKEFVISELKQSLVDYTLRLYTLDIYHELKMFQFVDPDDETKGMEARSGEKDDRVMSAAFANLGRLARFGAPMIKNFTPDSGPAPKPPVIPYEDRLADAIEEECEKARKPSGKRRRRLDKRPTFGDLTAKWN
jgi:hypothetical protein